MEKIRSRKFARLTAGAALTLTALAGCGGGDSGSSFDVSGFADQMSATGAMSEDQAKCIGEYINKEGSDDLKSEVQKAIDEGDDAAGIEDEATAKEFGDLMAKAGIECLTP